ncbi:hypothetical protein JTE90_014774 [Oedothorax gibbosus]|nr:hypothetical protein JTE90_014774 [Oedothorax gibbosus]
MAHRNWSPATVIEEHQTPRSYIVQLENGSEIRRNRVHIRPDNGIANDNLQSNTENPEVNSPTTSSPSGQLPPSNNQTTPPNSPATPVRQNERPKRLIKRPIKLNDFITN